jgi:RimJ/RimL family protein N-acetyltransferase
MKSAIAVRSWERDDLRRLAGVELSQDSLRSRFWTGVPGLPSGYLRSIEARWPDRWDAVVALEGDRLVGWAEYGRNAEAGEADVGICVADAAQGRGVGTLLLHALLDQASAAGLTAVYADIEVANRAAQALWRRVTRAAPTSTHADGDTLRHSLVLSGSARAKARSAA